MCHLTAEIIDLKGNGLSLTKIAKEAGVSVSTVRYHLGKVNARTWTSEIAKVRLQQIQNSRIGVTASTAAKGAATELMAAAEFLKRGLDVARPLYPISGVDLLVFRGSKFLRIEVKGFVDFSNQARGQYGHRIAVRKSTLVNGKLNSQRQDMSRFDFLVAYEQHSGDWLILPSSEIPSCGSIRLPWYETDRFALEKVGLNRWNLIEEALS